MSYLLLYLYISVGFINLSSIFIKSSYVNVIGSLLISTFSPLIILVTISVSSFVSLSPNEYTSKSDMLLGSDKTTTISSYFSGQRPANTSYELFSASLSSII